MSVKAMSYVWDTDLKGTQKLMLLAIADRCNDEGECFPGVKRLAKKCGITKPSARKILKKLEQIGELVIYYNDGIESGHGKTNRYFMAGYRKTLEILTPSRGIKSDTPEKKGVSKTTPQGVSKTTPQGVSKVIPNTSVDTSVDTSVITTFPDRDSQLENAKAKSLPAADASGGEKTTPQKSEGLFAVVPDVVEQPTDKLPEVVQYESSEKIESPKIASVQETKKSTVAQPQKEKSSAKKEKGTAGKLHAPAWGTDAQVLQDTMTAFLMIAWGLNPEDRFDKGKSKGLGQYRQEAKYLRGMGIHPGNLGDLYRYVQTLSRKGRWSTFTVAALRRYALEFLAQRRSAADNRTAPLGPITPDYDPPDVQVHITGAQFRDFLNRRQERLAAQAAADADAKVAPTPVADAGTAV